MTRAVVFDFSGTLFHVESAASALAAALGDEFVHWAPELVRCGAINGSGTPAELPADVADAWAHRDLSESAHRAAYAGMSQHAGLTPEQATRVYDRGISAAAWTPFPDTVEVLQRLRAQDVPVALLSNTGWDVRPVLDTAGVRGLFATLVLSYERGVEKPDPAIFELACAELGVAPADTLMVGDNAAADGAATRIGCRFVLVDPDSGRAPDTLLRAVAGWAGRAAGWTDPDVTSRR